MFTGIVRDLGRIRAIDSHGETRIEIETAFSMDDIAIGASICCSGVCLTVVERGTDWFAVQVSAETLSCTTFRALAPGAAINLERSLRLGDELGGHMVTGHVDGVATVRDIAPDGESLRFSFQAPDTLRKFIAPKGSVALDGVSLTVNEVEGAVFGVNIIPHTQQVTTFGGLSPGGKVNIEVDIMARYAARLLEETA